MKQNKVKLAIFDMDGTILDTLEDLKNSTNYALRMNGMPERTLPEIKSFVGNGIHKLIERAVPAGTDDAQIEKVFQTFHPYYKEHCADQTKPYDGIVNVIHALREKGVKTAVVSNKADYGVQALCDKYFPGLFDYAIGDKPGVRIKPYPDGVNEVLKFFGLQKEEAVYIGDSEVDYQTSVNAQMSVIMVSWGFREKTDILNLGAPFVIDSPMEILAHIDAE